MNLFKSLSNILQNKEALFSRNSELVKGAGYSFLIKTLGLGIGFLLQIVLARILKVDQYGVYMYVLAWLNILILAGKFGLDQASKKFIPSYISKGSTDKISSFVTFSTSRVFFTSLLLSAALTLISIYLSDRIDRSLFLTFVLGSILLLFNTQLALWGGVLEALKRIRSSLIPRVMVRPLLICLGVLGLHAVGIPTASAAMSINIMSTALTLLVVFYFLENDISFRFFAYSTDKAWLRTAIPLFLSSGIHLLLTQSDIILIGFFLDTDMAGIYSSVSKISQLVVFGLTAVNIITAPLISEYYTQNLKEKLQETMSLSALLTLILTLPVIFTVLLLSPYILNLFGSEFLVGNTALNVIVAGQLINAFSGSVAFLMTMTNYHKESLYILSLAALLNIIFNIIFIPKFGIEGAAFVTASTTVFWNLAMYFYMKRKLNIDSSILGLLKKS